MHSSTVNFTRRKYGVFADPNIDTELNGYYDKEYSVTCHHNGDFSGDVWVDLAECPDPGKDGSGVRIPFEVMQELVGRWVMRQKIRHMEDLDGQDFIEELVNHG